MNTYVLRLLMPNEPQSPSALTARTMCRYSCPSNMLLKLRGYLSAGMPQVRYAARNVACMVEKAHEAKIMEG